MLCAVRLNASASRTNIAKWFSTEGCIVFVFLWSDYNLAQPSKVYFPCESCTKHSSLVGRKPTFLVPFSVLFEPKLFRLNEDAARSIEHLCRGIQSVWSGIDCTVHGFYFGVGNTANAHQLLLPSPSIASHD